MLCPIGTTSVRSTGPRGSHAYRPPAILPRSDAAYDDWLEQKYRDSLPPSIDELPPVEIEDDAGLGWSVMRWLTVSEAAEILGITASTLRVQVTKGRIPSRTAYGRRLISEAAVDDYKRGSLGQQKGGRPKKGSTD